MTQIIITSEMKPPLKEPEGWFLMKAEHQHKGIRFASDVHEPVQMPEGPWEVTFQRYPKGGLATSGRGHSLEEAWSNASKAAVARGLEYGNR
jgi:hypothetical protein